MVGATLNFSIFLQTTESYLENSVHEKLHNLNRSWRELQETLENIKIETSDTLFRVRGQEAKRADKISFWKKQYEEARNEIEELKTKLKTVEEDLKSTNNVKSTKNKYVMQRNEELLNELKVQSEEKIKLVSNLLDDKSEFYQMSFQQRKEHFKKVKRESLEKYNKNLFQNPSNDSTKLILQKSVSDPIHC